MAILSPGRAGPGSRRLAPPRSLAAVALAAAVWASGASGARPAPRLEATAVEVKAAFLIQFARFTAWPPDAFASAPTACIGTLGGDPFGGALEAGLAGRRVHGRPVIVRHHEEPRAATGCHVVFVSGASREDLARSLAVLRGHAVLTVGDAPTFLADGGAIRLRVTDGRMRFEVNPEATARHDLRLGPELLRLGLPGRR